MSAEVWMWLDDIRKPPSHSDCGIVWKWVTTAQDAIELLKTGAVVFASLDHDLAPEHYAAKSDEAVEQSGMTVLNWMEEQEVWPPLGVRIHTMNPARKPVMLGVVERHYDRVFQIAIPGTYAV